MLVKMYAMNTYTLILLNTFTNEIHEFTVQNISNNDLFYEFEVKELFANLPDAEYEIYCFWNTYSDYKIDYSNDILDSKITVNNQTFTLRDIKPEVSLLKIINSQEKQLNYIEQKTSYLAYEQ